MRILFRGQDAQAKLMLIRSGEVIYCDQFPTGRLLVLEYQDKYDAWGELIDLLVDY